jgi:hypothetical protein
LILPSAFEESKQKGKAVKLVNCIIKLGQDADKFEILASYHSKVMNSLKKFAV